MFRRRIRFLVSALCIGVLFLSACSGSASSAKDGAAKASGALELKIGVIGPFTGQFAVAGESMFNGASMKAEEINAADQSVKITLLKEDDASNCDQSVNAAVKLIAQEKVAAILGAANSPCALTMVPVTAKNKIPQYTFAVGTAITTQNSKYVFRIAPGAPSQTKALAAYAIKTMGLKKFAIAHTRDEYGASVGEGFNQAIKDAGGEVALKEPWTVGDKDFTGLLIRVKQSGAQAIFISGGLADVALMAKQMRDAGMNQQILGDTGMANPDFAKLASSAANGAVVVEPFTVAAPSPTVKAFVDKYKGKYQKEPDSWVAEMYDAVGIIYEAAKKSGKPDPAAIAQFTADLAKNGGYAGILGKVSFDPTGESLYNLYIVQYKDGQKVILQSPN